MQVLGFLKSHINDAVAITCTIGELVKPLSMLYQLRCVPGGTTRCVTASTVSIKSGRLEESKVGSSLNWSKPKGSLVHWRQTAQGKFCAQEVSTGKTIPEVVPSQLHRLARCLHG